MRLGKCIIAAVFAFSAFPAFSGCVDNEELEILRELKSDFLTGNYDAFFEASDTSAMLPDNVELDTKVKIIQHIGVPTDCFDMVRKRHSESFETLITVFLNNDGQMIFLFFSVLNADSRYYILGVQLTTDYSEIFQYVR